MDKATAARVLAVAEHEVLDVVHRAEGWFALHHDMASHDEKWRPVGQPADPAQAPTEPAAEPAAESEPPANAAQAPTDPAPARAPRRGRS